MQETLIEEKIKQEKHNKGITLIALVVTIIVLLILAGVSITTLTGDNGIITRAEGAKKAVENESVRELVQLAVMEGMSNRDLSVDEKKLEKALGNSFGEKGTGYTIQGNKTEGWTITIPQNKSSYFVNSDGEFEEIDYEEPIDNSKSLVEGFVDDLGTRAMIYLYANPNTNKASDVITITDNNGDNLINVDGATQTTVKAVAKNGDKLEITRTSYAFGEPYYYLAYPVTQNGTYTFKSTKTGVSEPTITKIKVENIETFTKIDSLCKDTDKVKDKGGNTKEAYSYKGAVVPAGYYVDENSDVDTGLVITDKLVDENATSGYSAGNEWVWVPVVENEDYKYHLNTTSTENIYGTSIAYTNYSKLWKFTTDKSKTTDKTTIENLEATRIKPKSNFGNREPTVVLGSDDQQYDYLNYTNVYNRKASSKAKFNASDAVSNANTVSDLATQFRDDYDSMVESVDTYKGFYIGRYEITASGEKPGTPLSGTISGKTYTWYELYNECMYLNKGTNTESSMIYGTLWDATMKWLADKNYNVGASGERTSGYGNYNREAVTVSNSDNSTSIVVKKSSSSQKLGTGQTSYTRSNNIYDLSGNCFDWTQEAEGSKYRVKRGGNYENGNIDYTYSASRNPSEPSRLDRDDHSSRPQLYIK